MRRATAYCSSCSQIALVLEVYLHLFCRNLLLKCAATENRKKTLAPRFWGHKMVDVDTSKKLVRH